MSHVPVSHIPIELQLRKKERTEQKPVLQTEETFRKFQEQYRAKLGVTEQGFVIPKFKRITNALAVATILYQSTKPLTTGEVAKILTRIWKKIDLRNVSREVTSRWLKKYVCSIEKVNKRVGRICLNDEGKAWYASLLEKLKNE